MSGRFSFSYSAITVGILGAALLIAGGLLAYLSFTAEWAIANRLFTPLGFVISLTGIILLASLTSKEG
jgi:membrane-bound ClpP family serine protease